MFGECYSVFLGTWYEYIYTCIHICTHTHIHVPMYVYIYICISICVYIYIYTHAWWLPAIYTKAQILNLACRTLAVSASEVHT